MPSIVDVFRYVGDKASYHYADETTKEWGLARKMEKIALMIFDACPEHRATMREVAKGFLWSLKTQRPLGE